MKNSILWIVVLLVIAGGLIGVNYFYHGRSIIPGPTNLPPLGSDIPPTPSANPNETKLFSTAEFSFRYPVTWNYTREAMPDGGAVYQFNDARGSVMYFYSPIAGFDIGPAAVMETKIFQTNDPNTALKYEWHRDCSNSDAAHCQLAPSGGAVLAFWERGSKNPKFGQYKNIQNAGMFNVQLDPSLNHVEVQSLLTQAEAMFRSLTFFTTSRPVSNGSLNSSTSKK